MKKRTWKDDGDGEMRKLEKQKRMTLMKKKNNYKNKQRLGGGGLSLEAFANAKVKNNEYNPAIIKKRREFYKNAKYVNKYKKSLKQQNEQRNEQSIAAKFVQEDDETEPARKENKKGAKKNSHSLIKIYEAKREEEEKARMEREARIQAKKEETERAIAQRKELRQKMLKRTRSGQPVMKYRMEHLLNSLQNSQK